MKVNLLTKLRGDVLCIISGEGISVEKIIIELGEWSPSVVIILKDVYFGPNDPQPEVILKLFFPFGEEPTTEIKNIEKASEVFRQGLFEAIPKLQKYFWEEFIYESEFFDDDVDDDEE